MEHVGRYIVVLTAEEQSRDGPVQILPACVAAAAMAHLWYYACDGHSGARTAIFRLYIMYSAIHEYARTQYNGNIELVDVTRQRDHMAVCDKILFPESVVGNGDLKATFRADLSPCARRWRHYFYEEIMTERIGHSLNSYIPSPAEAQVEGTECQ